VITTTDRGAVIHFAGRHHLSPALRDGAPVLAGPDPGGRSGWAPFFSALEGRGLAARFDPDDGTSFATVPRREQGGRADQAAPATPEARAPVAPGREARRFLQALRGRFTG
jgi:hypothetical protein